MKKNYEKIIQLLLEENQSLREENKILREENEKLKIQLSEAMERIKKLERQLSLNSNNSSKPPSSDGLKKKPINRSLRKKGQNPSGGQKGHDGHTLQQVKNPDHIIGNAVKNCFSCHLSLEKTHVKEIIKRQVFDISEPRTIVIEHQSEVKICSCGKKNIATFSEEVQAPVQYGNRVKSMAVYLNMQQFIPEKRLQNIFEDVFQLPISSATLGTIIQSFTQKVVPIQEANLEELKISPVKHLDETGFRIVGETGWLHVISNRKKTHYRTSKKRGNVLDGVQGTIVHDHWKPYFTMKNVKHSLCNAHHLRELNALIEIEKEKWAFEMKRLLYQMRSSSPPNIDQALKFYDQIIDYGLKYHEKLPPLSGRKRRPGHNLLLRLKNFKSSVLRFATDENIPFTNNLAEQDIRMMKVKQKISGGFRSVSGAENFCIIRGFFSSCRKNEINLFQAILQVLTKNFSFA